MRKCLWKQFYQIRKKELSRTIDWKIVWVGQPIFYGLLWRYKYIVVLTNPKSLLLGELQIWTFVKQFCSFFTSLDFMNSHVHSCTHCGIRWAVSRTVTSTKRRSKENRWFLIVTSANYLYSHVRCAYCVKSTWGTNSFRFIGCGHR